jgi:hypothetical protein
VVVGFQETSNIALTTDCDAMPLVNSLTSDQVHMLINFSDGDVLQGSVI